MRRVLLVLGLLLVAGCAYRGDGELVVDGVWPLRSYRLELPEIDLEPGRHRFDVSGLPHVGSGPRVSLVAASDEPLVCTQLWTNVTLRLLTVDGEVLLEKAGPLNGIAQRVFAEGRNDAPGDSEWMPSGWRYADEAISGRAVPLEPGIDSLPQRECGFWSLETAPSRALAILDIEVGFGPAAGTLQISLSEGWK